MDVTAKLRYFRKSPPKVRLVVDLIRGLTVEKAEYQLNFLNKGSSGPILKLLKSAIANAENNFELKKENLFVKKVIVDQGPSLKRWQPRAFGRASEILKRSSHVTLILGEIKETTSKSKKIVKKKIIKDKPTSAKNKEKQKVVDYKEVKHDSKFNKEDSDIDKKSDQQNKPTSGLGKIKDRFSRKVGDK